MAMEFQLEKQKEERLRIGLLTVSEAAREIGVTYNVINWYLRAGQLSAPAARIAGRPRRYYVAADMAALREFFAAKS